MLVAAAPHPISPYGFIMLAVLMIMALVAVIVLGVVFRKMFRERAPQSGKEWAAEHPRTEDPSAFATASMQGVIEKLRAQERELARLHRLEQERARESERITEEVTRNMPTGLLLLSAKGSITSANPAAEAALGATGMQYRSFTEVLGEDTDLSRLLTSCLRDGTTVHRGEVQHRTPSGEVRQLGVTISPIERHVPSYARPAGEGPVASAGRERKVTGALCLMSDLTELTELQRQIRWKENLATLGEMSAGIAHEFKNALATISGYAQMLCGEAPPGELHENSKKILEQTRALTRVVTEFLRFARPLELLYETVPVRSLVERVAEEIHGALPELAIETSGSFSEIPGDEGLLRQALLNLTRNAAEAVRVRGAEGRVILSGSVEDRAGRKWQRLAVADNGTGIAPEDLPKIFVPFFTTKSDGTGLGLAVVQKVAMQHGGTVEARNRPGGGAEFILWLPLRQEGVAEPVAPLVSRI